MGVLQDIYRVEQAMIAALDAGDDAAFSELSDEMARLMEANDRGTPAATPGPRAPRRDDREVFQWSGPVEYTSQLPPPVADLEELRRSEQTATPLDDWRAAPPQHLIHP